MSQASRQPRLSRPTKTLAASAVGALLLALALAAPLGISAAPNPSGPGVPTRVAIHHDGNLTLELPEEVEAGITYDFTVTNLLNSSDDYALHRPNGTQFGNVEAAYIDGEHAGRFNVTFAGIAFDVAGEWTLRSSNSSWPAFTVSPAPPVVSIGDVSAGSLLSATETIWLSNVSDFGSATVTLAYDPAVVEITGVTNGNAGNLTFFDNATTGTLTLLVTTTDRPGPDGTFMFANVSMRAAGPAGQTSSLNITVVEMTDSDGAPISAVDEDGTFRSGILGDVDGDGTVSSQDADLLAAYTVGEPSAQGQVTLANADTNRDGGVTGVDVMYLRQHLAGARPSL